MTQIAQTSLLHSPGLRQFIKFCIIGFSSMIIDVGIAKYLTYAVSWQWSGDMGQRPFYTVPAPNQIPQTLALHWAIAQTLSFVVAVTNGFIWNSLWTFRGQGSGKRHEMYFKFVAVNVVGLLLNLLIMKSIFFGFTGRMIHQGTPPPMQWNIAKAVAVICVAFWNFYANKKWTFSD